MVGADLAALPLSAGMLARYRTASRRQRRAGLVGGHQMRRKGQSLDFRDFEQYHPGDDIRHVDWRASARTGNRNELLVRQYAAEEQMSLVISVDTRPTMQLPEQIAKMQIAAWLAESIAWIALESQDRVFLHRLFGAAGDSLTTLRGPAARGRVRPTLRRYCEAAQDTARLNLKPLATSLPPTSVWMILTDFYFDDPKQTTRLAREIARAQEGLCWVILVDLDSWPMERALLGEGARRIEGPGLGLDRNRFEITDENLRLVEDRLKQHKQHFFNLTRRSSCDLVHWPWPVEADRAPADFFKDAFLGDKEIKRLFMRDA